MTVATTRRPRTNSSRRPSPPRSRRSRRSSGTVTTTVTKAMRIDARGGRLSVTRRTMQRGRRSGTSLCFARRANRRSQSFARRPRGGLGRRRRRPLRRPLRRGCAGRRPGAAGTRRRWRRRRARWSCSRRSRSWWPITSWLGGDDTDFFFCSLLLAVVTKVVAKVLASRDSSHRTRQRRVTGSSYRRPPRPRRPRPRWFAAIASPDPTDPLVEERNASPARRHRRRWRRTPPRSAPATARLRRSQPPTRARAAPRATARAATRSSVAR
mmetsp:Transcript_5245/g.23395  ORF Transcript_5245/g.23395 Transcript_5245/m.23395 type:complete len:268 (+) Transcript_5245:901-1704(+)